MNIFEKLLFIQGNLVAPKNQYNKFGNFKYRNCEDIQEALKPLLKTIKATLIINDEIVQLGDRYYIKATAIFVDTETSEKIENTSYAREELEKKGMDSSQVTGATSSYARKYALNGLFCIDDNKDPDSSSSKEQNTEQNSNKYECEICGTPFTDFTYKGKKYTAKDGYEIAKKNNNGHALCNQCKKNNKDGAKNEQ